MWVNQPSLDRLLDEAFVDSRGLSVDPFRFLVSPPTDPELTSWISGANDAASQILANRYLAHLANAVGGWVCSLFARIRLGAITGSVSTLSRQRLPAARTWGLLFVPR